MTAVAPTTPPPADTWRMYRAMVGIGLLSGLLIVSAYLLTAPAIQRNRAAALQAAIVSVLPAARTTQAFALGADGRLAPRAAPAPGTPVVYAAYGADRRLVGVAIEASGMGYQDVIRVLYGWDPARDQIVGLAVLDLRDTPGLGDRIESDPDFLASVAALDVRLDAAGAALAQPITAAPRDAARQPWQVDTITGATITSGAVATMLGESAAFWIPRLRRQLADLAPPEEP